MQISMLVQQVRLGEELMGLVGGVDVCKIQSQGFLHLLQEMQLKKKKEKTKVPLTPKDPQ